MVMLMRLMMLKQTTAGMDFKQACNSTWKIAQVSTKEAEELVSITSEKRKMKVEKLFKIRWGVEARPIKPRELDLQKNNICIVKSLQ